jgi:hypothetical protein
MSDIVLSTVDVEADRNLVDGAITYTVTAQGATGLQKTTSIPINEIKFELKPGIADPILPGSVVFTWLNEWYRDRSGRIYKNIDLKTNAGTQVGTINYETGVITLTDWPANTNGSVVIKSLATTNEVGYINTLAFRTAGAPIRPGGLQITALKADGSIMTATANFNGEITGSGIYGAVDQTTGSVSIVFCDDPTDAASMSATAINVQANSVKYNCVVYSTVPLDADLIGLDPVRLPSDGRVPIFRSGDIAVLNNWHDTSIGTPLADDVVILPRTALAEVRIEDQDGVALDVAQYSLDLAAGEITFSSTLLLQSAASAPLNPPLIARHRIEHMSLIGDVQISGSISLVAPLSQDYDAASTTISSAVVYGDLQARVHHFFAQKSFSMASPVWSDTLIGDSTTSQYNDIDNPPEISNRGAITERWALVFTGATTFNIVGEKMGVIGTGTTSADTAPINPNTGVPYFAIRLGGWGTGWSTGNAIRFNTDSALAPLWITRVVTPGQATANNDSFTVQIRGDAD